MNLDFGIVLTVRNLFDDRDSRLKLFILIVYLLAFLGDSCTSTLILFHLLNELFVYFVLCLKFY